MVDCGNLHRTNMAEEELDQKPSAALTSTRGAAECARLMIKSYKRNPAEMYEHAYYMAGRWCLLSFRS